MRLICAACLEPDPQLLTIPQMGVLLCKDCMVLASAWLIVSEHKNVSPVNLYSIQLRILGDSIFTCYGPSFETMPDVNNFVDVFKTHMDAVRNSIYVRQTTIKGE